METQEENNQINKPLHIDNEKLKRIEKYVKEGRYPNAEDFINKAIDLLLYSEDRKEDFEKIIKRE